MKALYAVLALSATVGVVGFALSEATAGHLSTAIVALDENVPNEELDAARQPVVEAFPTVLQAIDAQGPSVSADDLDVVLVVPPGVSRVEIQVTATTPSQARDMADRVATGLAEEFMADRRELTQAEVDALRRSLDEQDANRLQQQVVVDEAIVDEARATSEVQRAAQAGTEETAARAELDRTIELVRSAAAARDEIADEENRLRRQLLAAELDAALSDDGVLIVPASAAVDVTGRPLRNGVEAALIAAVTLLTALSILHLAGREQ